MVVDLDDKDRSDRSAPAAARQTIDYWRACAKRAIEQSANATAIDHLRTALGLLASHPESSARARQELELQSMLALAQMAVIGQGSAEIERTYLRARDLCEQIGDAAQRFSVYRGLWAFYHRRARYDLARRSAQRLLSLSDQAENPAYGLEANRALGMTWLLLGEFGAAANHLDRGSALYDPQQHGNHAYLYGSDPGVACLSFGAYAQCLLGYPDLAHSRSREALALAERMSHPFSAAMALNFAGHIHVRRREPAAARMHAEQLLALGAEHQFNHWSAMGLILLGWAQVHQGEHDAGIAELRRGLTAFQATGGKRSLSFFLALLAEAYAACGSFAEGLRSVADALAAVAESGERHFEAELYRLKGLLSWRLYGAAAASEAEACFHQSLVIARRQDAKAWQLRGATSLASLWLAQHKRRQARALLQPIYSDLKEGHQTADMREARALLDELAPA